MVASRKAAAGDPWGPPGASVTGREFLSLTRIIPSSLSSLSALSGFAAARSGAPRLILPLALGALLLAMGTSVLGRMQERRWDAPGETWCRGSGMGAEGLLGALLSLGGLVLLARCCGGIPALLGLGALGWYSLVHTPLKRLTAFAGVPGALAGVLPPAMGWCAAGGDGGDPVLGVLGLVFYLWHVPHFWLLALLRRESCDSAALPTLARHFSTTTIQRLTFGWMCAAAAASLLLIPSGVVAMPVSQALLLAVILVWGGRSVRLLGRPAGALGYRRAFADMNLFILAVMGAVILG